MGSPKWVGHSSSERAKDGAVEDKLVCRQKEAAMKRRAVEIWLAIST
jgi:hypothetical protein